MEQFHLFGAGVVSDVHLDLFSPYSLLNSCLLFVPSNLIFRNDAEGDFAHILFKDAS